MIVRIPVEGEHGPLSLEGELLLSDGATLLVIFVHGSGSSRHSSRNAYVASRLREAGLATLLFDLLTESEDEVYSNRFDISLIARRLQEVTHWVIRRSDCRLLDVAYFGASTGAAAALTTAALAAAATEQAGATVGTASSGGLSPQRIRAVVSRGGRPDLAGGRIAAVRAPTLFIVGSEDRQILELNRRACDRLTCERRLEIIPGAGHLFHEPGTLETVAELATQWFVGHQRRKNR